MNYDHLYQFSFKIQTVGVKDVGDFKGVISELRYYFVGLEKQYEITKNEVTGKEKETRLFNKPLNIRERFAVYSFNVDNLTEELFIPFNQVGSDMLHDWLEASIHPDNLEGMKKTPTVKDKKEVGFGK